MFKINIRNQFPRYRWCKDNTYIACLQKNKAENALAFSADGSGLHNYGHMLSSYLSA